MPVTINRIALIALLTAAALQALDITITTLALPAVAQTLGLDFEAESWILTTYIVAMALMTPVAGVLSSALGRRRALLAAIGGVCLASLVCGFAQSLEMLLLARIAQGAAAGLITPLVQATLLDLTPKAEHGRAMSFLGAAIMVGPVLGPSLGGMLVDAFGWRAVFFANLPIGAAAFAGIAAGLGDLPPSRKARIDFTGFTIFGCGIVGLQLLLDRGPRAGWFGAREIRADALLALAGLAVALARALRRENAFPALAPFRDRNFAVTTACSFLAGFVVIGSIVLVPAMLQSVLGHDATQAGLAIAPRGVGTMAMMLAMSRKVGTIDHRRLLLVGVFLIALALLGLAMVGAQSSLFAVAALTLVQGLGVGLIFTPLSTAAFSFLAPELRADATGVYSLLRNVGGSTGVAVLSALALPDGVALAQRLASYRIDFLVLLVVVCIMGAAALFIRTDLTERQEALSAGGR